LIGKASLMILGIHIVIGILLNLIIRPFFADFPFSTFGVYIYMLTVSVIQVLACLPIYIIIKKLKLKYLI
jgi:hypothetical protein